MDCRIKSDSDKLFTLLSFPGLTRESKKTMDRRVKHGDDRMRLWLVGSILWSEPVLNLIGDLDGSDNDRVCF